MLAIPVAATFLEEKPLENGGVKVTISVPTRPMQRRLLRLPEYVKRDFELDAFGREVLQWCDGKNSVADLLDKFSARYRLSREESEKAVLTFLRTLTSKGLIVFAVRS